VRCARAFVGDEPFAVILPDDLIQSDRPCLAQLIDVWEQTRGNVVAVEEVEPSRTDRYGVLDVEFDDGKVARAQGLVEKPTPEAAPSNLAIIGRYVLDPQVMRALETTEPGAGGEIQLTDAMCATIGQVPFHGVRFEGRRFDCGDKVGFIEANLAFALARPEMKERLGQAINKITAEVGPAEGARVELA
jgi:UTP-glucose-1-phosphate uridylyltransferase